MVHYGLMLDDNNQDVKTDVEKENAQKCDGLDCDRFASENISVIINISACPSCAKKLS